ncbi:MAG: hypothetical protein HXY23_14065 [Parvularculaceae bacterium]|nr:hypothetical protein [Parvularculaceae bacterium]
MEIVLAVVSWIATILLPLLILSVPTDLILSKVKKDWPNSKEQSIYKTVQLVTLGVFCLALMMTVVLMGL